MVSKSFDLSPVDLKRIEEVRRWYAEEIRYASGTQSEQIVEAFATVPREQFLGPGPWQIASAVTHGPTYFETADDDPAHVYHNVLIAIDAARHLHNGSPGAWASWLSHVHPQADEQILHIGCGTGYYTAILAELTGPAGSVLAFEVDAEIARRAGAALAPWNRVHVVAGDGALFEADPTDLIVVGAGVSAVPRSWIDCLNLGGRLLVPLTAQESAGTHLTAGRMLSVKRLRKGYAARFIGNAGFYPSIGTQDAAANQRLLAALQRRDDQSVQSLRVDTHVADQDCWLHSGAWCLSKRAV